MENNTSKKKRIGYVLMIALMMLCVSGCVEKDIGKIRAKRMVLKNLEDHYGGDFDVMSIERKSIGVSALQDHIYALEVYSEELDETISVQLKRDGSWMTDNFEVIRYGDDVEEEIASFELHAEGWEITEQRIEHFLYYPKYDDEDYSTDYEAYKRADDKLYVSTDADITGTDNDAIAESIYAYLAQFHDSGLKYYFEVRKKGGKGKIIKEQKEGDEVTVQDIKQVLDSL